jgi:hypothetical protein
MFGSEVFLASMLLNRKAAHLFSPPKALIRELRRQRNMTNLKRKLMAVAMAVVMTGVVSFGAFAQKREPDKRPTKPQDTKVVVEPKGKPPQNANQGDKRNDGKKGKP